MRVEAFRIRGDQALRTEDLDMTDGTCCSILGWCARADALLNLPGFHVLAVVHEDPGRVVVSIETDTRTGRCCPRLSKQDLFSYRWTNITTPVSIDSLYGCVTTALFQ